MSYTADVLLAAAKFANTNYVIEAVRKINEKAPQVASWLTVEILDATDDDYYRPEAIIDSCKVIKVDLSQKACDKISCNSMKEKAPCRPGDVATMYRVGGAQFDVQCQPACFHLAGQEAYDDEGVRSPDMPMLKWNSKAKKCRLVNSTTIAWQEKPYYRSETHYEKRMNDFPIGFSRANTNSDYGSGFSYELNKHYCGFFEKQFRRGNCEYTVWEILLDSVIGMSLINTVKGAINEFSNGGRPFDDPTGMSPMPALDKTFTLDGWRADINPSFVLPELIDTTPKSVKRTNLQPHQNLTKHDLRRSKETHPNNEMSNFTRRLNGLPPNPSIKIIKPRKNGGKRKLVHPGKTTNQNSRKRFLSTEDNRSFKKMKTSKDSGEKEEEEEEPRDWTDEMEAIFQGMIDSMINDPNFWVGMGFDIGTGLALEGLKKMLKKVIEKLGAKAGEVLMKTGGSLGLKVLGASLKSLTMKAVVSFALKLGAKLVTFLAKMLVSACNVVGWIMMVIMFVDIILMFCDPTGLNNEQNAAVPIMYNDMGEQALRDALQASSLDYEFIYLKNVILTEEEDMVLTMNQLKDVIVYLDSLTVNSAGSRIDKGDEIDLNGSSNDYEGVINASMAKRSNFNSETFAEYNKTFLLRTQIQTALASVTAGLFLTSAVSLLFGLAIVAWVFITLAIVSATITILNIKSSVLPDLVDKYNLNTLFNLPSKDETQTSY